MKSWLTTVRLDNIGLVRRLEIQLTPGLTAITGESGSGKSMILTAVDAGLGARVSAEQVGPFGERARVRLTFQVDPEAAWWTVLAAWDLVPDELLVVQREWGRDGRSTLRLQDQVVPVTSVRAVLEDLADLAGQHEHQRLMGREHARQWLDHRVEPGLLAEVARTHAAWQALLKERDQFLVLAGDREAREALRDDVRYLAELAPETGEEERLRQQVTRWQDAERLAAQLQILVGAIDGTGDGPSALALARQAERTAQEVARLDAAAADWPARLAASRDNLEEVSRQAWRLAEQLEYDPAEAQRIADRLDAIARARRRFHVDGDALTAVKHRLEAECTRLDEAEWHLSQLERQLNGAEAQFRHAALALSNARRLAADAVLPAVDAVLHRLELPRARLMAAIEEAPPAAHGTDRVEWLFTSHESQEPRPLSRVASGGELARVALALRVVQAEQGVLLLDEVDAGLGGQAARQVAALLREMAASQQVVVVSHQPVVAGAADAHWRVVRDDSPSGTEISVVALEGDARVREVARMLSGTDDSTAVAHARRLVAGEEDGQ